MSAVGLAPGGLLDAVADLNKVRELGRDDGFSLVAARRGDVPVLLVTVRPQCEPAAVVRTLRRLRLSGRLRVAERLASIPAVMILLAVFGMLSAFGNAFYDLAKDAIQTDGALQMTLPAWPMHSVVLFLVFLLLLVPLGLFSQTAISGDLGSVTGGLARLARRLFVPPAAGTIIANQVRRLLKAGLQPPRELRIVCGAVDGLPAAGHWEILDGILRGASRAGVATTLHVLRRDAASHAERCNTERRGRAMPRWSHDSYCNWPVEDWLSPIQRILLQVAHGTALHFTGDSTLHFLNRVPAGQAASHRWAVSRGAVLGLAGHLPHCRDIDAAVLDAAFESLIEDFNLLRSADNNPDLFCVEDTVAWCMLRQRTADACRPEELQHHLFGWLRAMMDNTNAPVTAHAVAFALILESCAPGGTNFSRSTGSRCLFTNIIANACAKEDYGSLELIWPMLRGQPFPPPETHEAFSPLRGLQTDTLRQMARLLEACKRYDEADFVYAYLAGAYPFQAGIARARLLERSGRPDLAFIAIQQLLAANGDGQRQVAVDTCLRLDAMLQAAWCVVSGFLWEHRVSGKRLLTEARTLADSLSEGSLSPIQRWRLDNYAAQYLEWAEDYPGALDRHRKALDTPGVGLKEVSGTLVNLGLTWRKDAIARFFPDPAAARKSIGLAADYGQRGYALKGQIGDLDELHVAGHNLALTALWHSLMVDDEADRQTALFAARDWVEKALRQLLDRGTRKKLDAVILEGLLCRRLGGGMIHRLDEAMASWPGTEDAFRKPVADLFAQANAPMPLGAQWRTRIARCWETEPDR